MPSTAIGETPFDWHKFDDWLTCYKVKYGFNDKQVSGLFGIKQAHLQRMKTGQQAPSFNLYAHMIEIAGEPFTAWIRDKYLDR